MVDESGDAFPTGMALAPSGDIYNFFPGMTKREYFAGQVLASMASNTEGVVYIATRAVRLADALIAELAKEPAP